MFIYAYTCVIGRVSSRHLSGDIVYTRSAASIIILPARKIKDTRLFDASVCVSVFYVREKMLIWESGL